MGPLPLSLLSRLAAARPRSFTRRRPSDADQGGDGQTHPGRGQDRAAQADRHQNDHADADACGRHANARRDPTPAASTPAAAPAPGYLGDIFGGGGGNPCNFASGYQFGDCNPTGETEQQYIQNPGGPAPGTSTNAQGCYYVKMGEGYCPSTNTYIPMQDPNG